MRETLRSYVKPWELDAVDHFTVAFYCRAVSSATMRLLVELGWELRDPDLPWTKSCWTRFFKELQGGDAYHVLSGVIEAGDEEIVLGHKLINSEHDELCTTFVQRLHGGAKSAARADAASDFPEREPARRAEPGPQSNWVRTATTLVRPEDLDPAGRMDLSAFIHHASDANVQVQNAIGMTSSYMRESRIGYATAEYQLTFLSAPPPLGTAIETKSTVAHIGNSSLWFVHRFHDASNDQPLAELAQMGVHLDLAARRPSPVPDHIRERVAALIGEEC